MSLFARLIPSALPRAMPSEAAAAAPEKRMIVNSVFAPNAWDGNAITGDIVGETRAMQSMAVFACVRLLADTIASMPWYVYRRDSANIPHRVFPSPQVVRQPCPEMDLFEWKWMVVATLALRGNSFHMITGRDNGGNPTSLLPIHPDLVFLERRNNVLEWYDPIYRVAGERVNREDMIHIRRFTLPGQPMGLSPIQQAARAININLTADEYGLRYFKDSASPSSVLRTEQTLTDDEVAGIQAEWMASHGGHRYPAVLTGGFDWKPISISPEESQFLQTRNYQVADIARFYGIPPHLVGDQEKATSWGSGIEQMNLGLYAYTLNGWTTCMESAISNKLPRGQVVRFDPNILLRGDVKTRYEAYQLARNIGMSNVDELRAQEDKPPLPDGLGQGYIQPLNFGPLGFDPATVPMPKTVPAGTDAPGTPSASPGGGKGLEAEPPGIGSRGRHELYCRFVDGRPEWVDRDTVNMQEER